MITLQVKFELTVSCVTEETPDRGNADFTSFLKDTKYVLQLIEQREAWEQKTKLMLTHLARTLKGILKIFHHTENAKDKMLEADLNLEKNMELHQSIEKMVPPCGKV